MKTWRGIAQGFGALWPMGPCVEAWAPLLWVTSRQRHAGVIQRWWEGICPDFDLGLCFSGSIPPGFCFILFNWMRNIFCLWKQPNVPDWESRSQALRTSSRAMFRVPLSPPYGCLRLFSFETSKWTLYRSFRNARKMQFRWKSPSWTKSQ